MKETIKVTGMSCKHCKSRVEKKLKETDGVKSAEVNLENSEVTVETDSEKINIEEIKDIINSLGYKA